MSASFIATLKTNELAMLRSIVKRVHLAHVPDSFATDKECDKLIESLGPEIVERMIRFGVDKGLR